MSTNSNPFANGQAFTQLNDEARKAMTGAFDAMSKWRHEMNSMGEKNSSAVFDKMSEAAKAMGWPAEFVDMTRQQMTNATKMQAQVIDQVMDTWQKQATSPTPSFQMPSMPAFPGMPTIPGMPTFPGMPSFGGGSGSSSMFPGMPDMSSMPMMPMQFWMQAAEMWQKNWATAMQSMMEMQKSSLGKAGKGPFG